MCEQISFHPLPKISLGNAWKPSICTEEFPFWAFRSACHHMCKRSWLHCGVACFLHMQYFKMNWLLKQCTHHICYAWLGYIWFPAWVFRHVKPVCVKTRLSKITFLPIDNSEKFGDIRYADIVALIFYVWLCCFWWQFSIQCIAYFPKYMPACLRFVYLMTIIK